jgi:hypothetical protein
MIQFQGLQSGLGADCADALMASAMEKTATAMNLRK